MFSSGNKKLIHQPAQLFSWQAGDHRAGSSLIIRKGMLFEQGKFRQSDGEIKCKSSQDKIFLSAPVFHRIPGVIHIQFLPVTATTIYY